MRPKIELIVDEMGPVFDKEALSIPLDTGQPEIVYMKYREDPDTSTPENTLNSPVPQSQCFLLVN